MPSHSRILRLEEVLSRLQAQREQVVPFLEPTSVAPIAGPLALPEGLTIPKRPPGLAPPQYAPEIRELLERPAPLGEALTRFSERVLGIPELIRQKTALPVARAVIPGDISFPVPRGFTELARGEFDFKDIRPGFEKVTIPEKVAEEVLSFIINPVNVVFFPGTVGKLTLNAARLAQQGAKLTAKQTRLLRQAKPFVQQLIKAETGGTKRRIFPSENPNLEGLAMYDTNLGVIVKPNMIQERASQLKAFEGHESFVGRLAEQGDEQGLIKLIGETPRIRYTSERNLFEIRYDADSFLRNEGVITYKEHTQTLKNTVQALRKEYPDVNIVIPETQQFFAAKEVGLFRIPSTKLPEKVTTLPGGTVIPGAKDWNVRIVDLQKITGGQQATATFIRRSYPNGLRMELYEVKLSSGKISVELAFKLRGKGVSDLTTAMKDVYTLARLNPKTEFIVMPTNPKIGAFLERLELPRDSITNEFFTFKLRDLESIIQRGQRGGGRISEDKRRLLAGTEREKKGE